MKKDTILKMYAASVLNNSFGGVLYWFTEVIPFTVFIAYIVKNDSTVMDIVVGVVALVAFAIARDWFVRRLALKAMASSETEVSE